jgi:hypothetical protein
VDEVTVAQAPQPAADDRMADIRESSLDLYGPRRSIAHAPQNLNHPLLGKELQGSHAELVLFGHSAPCALIAIHWFMPDGGWRRKYSWRSFRLREASRQMVGDLRAAPETKDRR